MGNKLFRYIKKELGIDTLENKINSIPVLNDRYLKLLTPMESLYLLLLEPEGDDSLVMHKLRCMGLCGGWKTKEQYDKGFKQGASHGK